MRAWILGIIVALFVGSAAQAAPIFVGAGTATCSTFFKMKKENPELTDLTLDSWLKGYLSGVNSVLGAMGQKVYDLSGLKGDQALDFMHSYCVRNPSANYQDGTIALMSALSRTDAPPKR